MKKLVVLASLAGLFLVADVSAKAFAESKIEERTRASLPGAEVAADIRAFPFLPRLLLAGSVKEVDFTLDKVGGSTTVPLIRLDLHGVELDRDLLLKERRAELVGIDRGTAAVEITAAQLTQAAGRDVQIGGGQVTVSVAGRFVGASVAVEGGQLVLRTDGLPDLSVSVPRSDLVPCATNATVLSGRVRVSCSIEEIPPGLVAAAQPVG